MGIALITNNILSDSGSPLTSVITGSLTNNYIPKATGTSTLGNSIIYENATGIGIGTNGPLASLHVQSSAPLTAIFDCGAADTYISWENDTFAFGDIGSAASLATGGSSNDFAIRARSTYNLIFATDATEKMRLTNGGKLGIGTTVVPTGRLLGVSGGAQFNGAALMEGANFSIIPAANGQDGVILNVGYDTGTDYGSLFINTGGNTSMTLTKNGAVTFAGSATATSIIKVGGTSSQFLMADGSVNTSVSPTGAYLPLTGGTLTGMLNGKTFVFTTSTNSAPAGVVENLGSTDAHGLYVNIGSSSTGYGFRVDKNGSALFTVANSGAATFSSSVTIGSNFKIESNGDTYQLTTGGAALWAATANVNYPTYGFYGDTGLGMYRPATDALGFVTSDTERMRITSGGNVGIGNATPGEKLVVNGKGYFVPNLPVVISGQGAGYYGGNITLASDIGSTQGANRIWSRYDGSGRAALSFETATTSQSYNSDPQTLTYTEYMRIAGGTGNVLIGTTTDAGYKLDVNGTGRFSGDVLISKSTDASVEVNSTTSTSYSAFYHSENGTAKAYWEYINSAFATTARRNYLEAYNLVGGFAVYTANAKALDISTTGAATFSSSVAATQGNGKAFTARSGNAGQYTFIGIGRTSDDMAVGVAGSTSQFFVGSASGDAWVGATNGTIGFGNDTSGTATMIVKGGNVGIGTTSPASKLDVAGGIVTTNGAGTTYNQFANSGNDVIWENRQNGAIIIRTATSTERMRIAQGGNVLIGTTTDFGNKLYVNGTAAITGAATFSSTISATYLTLANISSITAYVATTYQADSRTYIAGVGGSLAGYIEARNSFYVLDNNAGVVRFYINSSGNATFSGSVTATSFFESSDATIKTLIKDNYQTKGIESVTAKLYTKNGKEELGYFAQDLQGILPSAVSKGTDGLLSLSYREVHTAKIARLEKRVEELEQLLNLN